MGQNKQKQKQDMKACNSEPIVKVYPNGDPEIYHTVARTCGINKMEFNFILFY